MVSIDTNVVQRHWNIVLDCLRDGDISIRRRALELSYALINESNVQVMVRELLAFLEGADNEFKLRMTTQICVAAERLAPNKRCQIDTACEGDFGEVIATIDDPHDAWTMLESSYGSRQSGISLLLTQRLLWRTRTGRLRSRSIVTI